MPLLLPIQEAIGTAALWTASSRILRKGEIGIEQEVGSPTIKMKVGDGTTAWASLPYFPGAAGGLVAYTHTQGSASATWTINHNLGYNPLVTLLSAGGLEFEGTVTHTSVNQTVCSFNSAVAGSARLL